ncbi:Protein arginine methyltransferase NDUFAF7, mitochondrial [Bagarius yarrelli]|uniref:Protein arginine methyltransferase NDUFAF7 n=1 Tax=Bagarius yarrelli TaxID=175774 RepID=A0A556UYE9_BAGYA|nr:Protein arginine methyltransferase NDUFAF7, mitochondrial [Bagarius yarrelli]
MGTIQKLFNFSRTSVSFFALSLTAQRTWMLSRSCSSFSSETQAVNPSMLRHLVSKITATGPITVAEYMREVLTNPVSGYYVKNDMLGADGDFITSPEISQIFGELLGIWCVSEWMAAGKPKTFQLVELGPGRGSLTSDVLRVFGQLQSVLCGASVSVHLVEVSPKLSQVQAHCLVGENTQADEQRQHVEVCAEGGVIVQKLANRISEDGGAALIADYGHSGTKTDTFRGFKGHKLHDVLEAPGRADLTADVDFNYLRKMAGDAVVCFGPITQRAFLKNMGIDTRLQVLLKSCKDSSTRAQLVHGYSMLTEPEKMGHRFQFLSMLHPSRLSQPEEEKGGMARTRKKKVLAPLPVAGFTELGLN